MTHDPLCPNVPEHWDGQILWPAKCQCDLISKVRAEERDACIEDVASFYASGDNTEYWRGFGKGLTKAISLLHMGRNEQF